MRDQILSRLQPLQRSWAAFSAAQKTIAVIGGLALVLGAVMVFRWASTPSYAPLFTNMAPADASAVVDKLNADGTPYKLSNGGTTVMVPQNAVYDARIKLSGEGLPSQSTEGYGLLDKQKSLSTSQFQEQTSYKRAIEGELDKTIEALDPVSAAVVHVAMPQEELFSTDTKPTTASVLIKTRPGATLTSQQVQSVVHLVSSSVTGLDPKQVTVSDSTGAVLSAAGDDTGAGAGADSRSEQVKDFEDRMKNSVEDVLTPIVGPGNSATQVTADLNFDKTLTNTTRYFTGKKIPALTSTEKSEEYGNPNGTGTAGGVVGPDGQMSPSAGASAGSSYSNTEKTSDNAIDKTVEQREAAPGNVETLHVGVVIDTRSLGASTPDQVQSLVESALGIDKKRGDTVTVTTMPFDRSLAKAAAAELAAADKADAHDALMGTIKTGGIALVGGAVLLLAWLRGRKRRKLRDQATTYVVEQLRSRSEQAALPPGPPAAEVSGVTPGQLRLAARDEIAAMVEGQPEEVAQLLRGWLVEANR